MRLLLVKARLIQENKGVRKKGSKSLAKKGKQGLTCEYRTQQKAKISPERSFKYVVSSFEIVLLMI